MTLFCPIRGEEGSKHKAWRNISTFLLVCYYSICDSLDVVAVDHCKTQLPVAYNITVALITQCLATLRRLSLC